MLWTNVDRAVRFLRRRRGWRQKDLGDAAGVSRQAVSRLELRQLQRMRIGVLCAVAAALGASVHIELRWRGEQLDRLIDADHAAIQERVAAMLTSAGWLLRTEVSFSHFGERGRCDLVAFHSGTGILVVIEIKSQLGDLQETLGRLDVKRRLGTVIASELAWPAPRVVVSALVLAESSTNRRHVGAHAALFQHLDRRGRAALGWLHRPDLQQIPRGLLWFEKLSDSRAGGTTRSGRVRKSPAAPRAGI